MTIRSLLVKSAGVLLALTTLTPLIPAAAQQYPTKPIRLIIPFAPGGGDDGSAPDRGAARRELGRQIIVDNRGGAGGMIGSEMAAKAPKDGYTLLVDLACACGQPVALRPQGPLRPDQEASHRSGVLASGPNVLVVNPNFPAKNVKELIELAKKSPGKVGWATRGRGRLPASRRRAVRGANRRQIPARAVQGRRASDDRRRRRP